MLLDQKRYRVEARPALIVEKTFDILSMDGAPLGVAMNGVIHEREVPLITLHGKLFGHKTKVTFQDRNIGTLNLPVIADADGFEIATLVVDDRNTQFQLIGVDGSKLAEVIREWGGFVKETIGTENSYEVSITPAGEARPDMAALLVATVLKIDDVYPRDVPRLGQ